MKILWISPNGGNYKENSIKGSGGWVGSLETELVKKSDVELGIAFPHSSDNKALIKGKVTYFPLYTYPRRNNLEKIFNIYFRNKKKENKILVEKILECIDLFQPDIVHIWGVENDYARVIPYICDKCKLVVHIQGLTSLYKYTYLPPYVSIESQNKANSIKDVLLLESQTRKYNIFRARAVREKELCRYVKYWIGRTDWDKNAIAMLSPGSKYYHCDELMRNDFNGQNWRYHYNGDTIYIHTSISPAWYKGIDVIIKTASILLDFGVGICWNVYGVKENSPYVSFFKKLYGESEVDSSVHFWGNVDAETIKNSLLKSDVFVHPSYIENSSNAIAEAMMLGVPTIAQYVGGNPSMLKENSGVLVAPNEPYMMAYEIIRVCDKDWAETLSKQARLISQKRQSKDTVVNCLLNIYNDILDPD